MRAASCWSATPPSGAPPRTGSCPSRPRSKPRRRLRPRRRRTGASDMKVAVKNLDAKEVGSIDLADEIFGVTVRRDILARVINWQLAKRRAGTHKAKTISEIQGTTKKP